MHIIKKLSLDMVSKINKWNPLEVFMATDIEVIETREIIKSINWSKKETHLQFKKVEKSLLIHFRNYINSCRRLNHIPVEQLIEINTQWRRLALVRDLHDYLCGRDKKHHIRTDDCRRFISCVIKGLHMSEFSKPVARLLCGENAPREFTHPAFVQFNY